MSGPDETKSEARPSEPGLEVYKERGWREVAAIGRAVAAGRVDDRD